MRGWALPLLAALALACKPPGDQLAGSYRSTWGLCVVEIQGNEAAIAYPRGAMRCQIEPQHVFRCSWQSGEARGKATFRRQADQTLRGTWGSGDSDSDGGGWIMSR